MKQAKWTAKDGYLNNSHTLQRSCPASSTLCHKSVQRQFKINSVGFYKRHGLKSERFGDVCRSLQMSPFPNVKICYSLSLWADRSCFFFVFLCADLAPLICDLT